MTVLQRPARRGVGEGGEAFEEGVIQAAIDDRHFWPLIHRSERDQRINWLREN
jgi:hypothetical protein